MAPCGVHPGHCAPWMDKRSEIGSLAEVTKEYRPWTPEQTFLLPPSPTEWVPEGYRAYFVPELVGEFDVSGIEDTIQSKDGRGTRPYSPRRMTALLLYAYCVGIFSSRKVERAP
jgi:transposase